MPKHKLLLGEVERCGAGCLVVLRDADLADDADELSERLVHLGHCFGDGAQARVGKFEYLEDCHR